MDNTDKLLDTPESARFEYNLAVTTQMHFNEILMKYRSFGIAAVFAIFSYAISRPSSDMTSDFWATQTQVIGVTGIILTVLLGLVDIFYFLPLLLGAVARSLAIEKTTSYRLASEISKHVPKCRAYILFTSFYLAIAVAGVLLVCFVLPVAAKSG